MARAKLRLPYPTVVSFERALERLSVLSPGDRVQRGKLAELGFAANAISPILEALRFLGLIDAAGVVQSSIGAFRRAPRPLVARALAAPLERIDPPYSSRQALAVALAPELDMTPATVPLAATFLVWLAEQAGIALVEREGAKPGARPGVPRPGRLEPLERRAQGEPIALAPGAAVTFQLMVDRKTTRQDLERMLREVNAAIQRGGR